MSLSTHVLNATTGRPATGVSVELRRSGADGFVLVGSATTDGDGRVRELDASASGVYRLTFGTGAYFAASNTPAFYPEVSVTFEITDAAAHHHVPLLLSPFAYSTYRGS